MVPQPSTLPRSTFISVKDLNIKRNDILLACSLKYEETWLSRFGIFAPQLASKPVNGSERQ
jgi:hypothetical protein